MAVIVPILSKFDDSGVKKLKGAFSGMKGLVAGAFSIAAIGAGIAKLKEFAMEAQADNKAQELLAFSIRRSTKATAEQIAGTEKLINKLQNATGVLDDELRPAMANLVRSTGSVKRAQELLQVAVNASAMSGKPLETVSKALAKAHNGQTTALVRMFPELKKSKNAIKDLATESKGFAEKAADPFKLLEANLSDLRETIGNAVLPFFKDFVGYLRDKVIPKVKDFFTALNNPKTQLGASFAGFKDSVTKLGEAFGIFFAQFSKSKTDGWSGFIETLKWLSTTLDSLISGFTVMGEVGRLISKGKFGQAISYMNMDTSSAARKIMSNRVLNQGSGANTTSSNSIIINVNGVVGDKASVGKAVKEAITAYDKQNGTVYRGGR